MGIFLSFVYILLEASQLLLKHLRVKIRLLKQSFGVGFFFDRD